ncbi:hypothetical protein CEXT_218281, partial [Caerostris extrusa]
MALGSKTAYLSYLIPSEIQIPFLITTPTATVGVLYPNFLPW